MHTCSSRVGGGGIRGGCGATGAARASPANFSTEQQTQDKPRCMIH